MDKPAKAIKPRSERVNERLAQIIPLCDDLKIEEMAWITAACLKLLTLKVNGEWERMRGQSCE